MGAVASRLADVVVLTSDNPRSEDPAGHHRTGALGHRRTAEWWSSPTGPRPSAWPSDRARPGDVVLLAGKGHETAQGVGPRTLPFDDRVEAAAALAERFGRRGGGPVISLMTSGGVALWVAVLTTPVLIRWLLKNNIGQQIREDGPQVHIAKAGRRPWVASASSAAVVIGFLAAHVVPGVHLSRRGRW